MKFSTAQFSKLTRRGERAFTMVEIALCLAIIGFAMIAIIGVLPIGMRVQQENREETIINQDATFLLEAIRSGSEGLDDLTNYINSITIYSTNQNKEGTTATYTNISPFQPTTFTHLSMGLRIIGLLSTPKYEKIDDDFLTNTVVTRTRAMSGLAINRDPENQDFAFAYQIISEIVPLNVYPDAYTNYTDNGLSDLEITTRSNTWFAARNLMTNFHELRLTFQWPLYTRREGNNLVMAVGNNRKTFRTTVAGQLVRQNNPGDEEGDRKLFLLEQNQFRRTTNTLANQ